jgi:hypothetical protein
MKLLDIIQPLGALARSRALMAGLAAALTFTACGGGGGGDSPNSPPTGGATADLVSQGVISGFGSVIVNGVRYDDSKARVEDEDEDEDGQRSKDDLRLGMVVTVSATSTSSSTTATGTGTASVISFGSNLKGPVQSISAGTSSTSSGSTSISVTATATGSGAMTASTATTIVGSGSLVILGQTVIVGTTTVFDPVSLPNGFASIATGNILEVHGYLSPSLNTLVATRISKENNANAYKITGNINSLNAVSKSFKIGTESFSYASTSPDKLRVTPVDGLTVKVRLSTVQSVTGTWDVTRMKTAKKAYANNMKVEIEGLITEFTSATKFSVGTVAVDASNASFPKGTASLALGQRVEVKGTIVDGKLIATRVKLEDEDDEQENEVELHGAISALDAAAKTFMLRGQTVSYAGTVQFERGSLANLVNGAEVEVKGQSSGGGTMVQAKRIKFEK